ncbi:MAG TPA: fumarate reductase/succinate dehydrogenase flavoprotein subunit, partial [Ignavibacteriaceae bacterium]|nr:fumarate reductase/succinate dehydrogenase flavoprotein subunit [Ignavibacteriaceae bacterium]
GANRLGASALMQGLADGYFVIPYTMGDYLATTKPAAIKTDHPEFEKVASGVRDFTNKLLAVKGKRTVDDIHKQLGRIMWNKVGMARHEKGLKEAISEIRELKAEFWRNVTIPGSGNDVNQTLERAGRLADYFELGELIATDALNRNESCGAHFRVEHQFEDGEAKRDDENYSYVAAWEFAGENKWNLHKEELKFEYLKLAVRSYK